jgi:hypothetical protein
VEPFRGEHAAAEGFPVEHDRKVVRAGDPVDLEAEGDLGDDALTWDPASGAVRTFSSASAVGASE